MKFSYVFRVVAAAMCLGISFSVLPAAQDLTPAQQRAAAAQRQVQSDSKKPQAYNDLAIALVERARETANSNYLGQAQQAVTSGLSLAANDFQLQKTQIAILLGNREFASARERAARLNRQVPDDVTIYGYLAEADIALGNYEAAEKSAQWMLNLLPNNVPGLLIGAQLRDVYGDPDGALEMLDRAYTETSPAEAEELAWIANQIASVEIDRGELDAAHRVLLRAEKIFPLYPYTLQNLSRVKLGERKWPEALALLRQEEQIAPSAHVNYRLARAQELAGKRNEAAATYASFEAMAKARMNDPDNANRELILYYSAQASKHALQALALAEHEIRLRQDVWTLEVYAEALYANGQYAEAEIQLQKALGIGVRTAEFFNLAGQIAQKLGKQQEAEKYFRSSLQMSPSSEPPSGARTHLGSSSDVLRQEPTRAPVASPLYKESPAGPTPNLVGAPRVGEGFLPVPLAVLTPRATETERTIQNLQARVKRNPKQAIGYSALGAAFFQRARETGDVQDYQLAEESLNRSLDLVPNDFSAAVPLATMAEVCMGEHRFADALTYAQKSLALGSGDLSPFAIIGDAYADMGEYEKADAAYSRLQSTGEPASEPRTAYVRESRLAYLKFIAGDTDGAIGLMQSAVIAGNEARLPSENLAWLYYELGEFYFQTGAAQSANDSYLAALRIRPGDYRALAGLGKVRATQGRYQEAIVLYQRAIAVVPMPIYVAELGDLFNKAGNATEAAKQYQLVEFIGTLGHINQVLHNRDLALFYADHDTKLHEALGLARKEFEVRHDVYTWDTLAWTLYKNRMYQDANEVMEHALRLGTQDSLLLYHAGMIAAKIGQSALAQQYLNRAITVNPYFHVIYADSAKQELALLRKQATLTATGELKHAH
ncbi:MAG: tetratricopeptide repeat protein [Acidobacteriota bacterium]|nr:tetratricopeptide repeat protein [Acidobacteriota bacterium]